MTTKCEHCQTVCFNEQTLITHRENCSVRLKAKVERLLDLIEVHVDPTGFEDDPDMQMAMAELQKREHDG